LKTVEQKKNITFRFDFMGAKGGEQPVGKYCDMDIVLRNMLAKKRNNWTAYANS
jgi:hypothetical protein